MKVSRNFVAADADERRGGAKERTVHGCNGGFPQRCGMLLASEQVDYGKPQAPGVAAKVEEAGPTR
jgi:hypothetical protein